MSLLGFAGEFGAQGFDQAVTLRTHPTADDDHRRIEQRGGRPDSLREIGDPCRVVLWILQVLLRRLVVIAFDPIAADGALKTALLTAVADFVVVDRQVAEFTGQ